MKFHVIASGSKGNCTLIEEDGVYLVIDIGITEECFLEYLKINKIGLESITYALFTHEHCDHIKSEKLFDVSKKYAGIGTIKLNEGNILEPYVERELGPFKITPLRTSHDANNPLGFLIKGKNDELAFITDTGKLGSRTLKFLKNKDYYIFESNHDNDLLIDSGRPIFLIERILSTIGHLSNYDSANYLSKLIGDKTKEVVLAHLSEECNTPGIALKTHQNVMQQKGIDISKIKYHCASQYEPLVGGARNEN